MAVVKQRYSGHGIALDRVSYALGYDKIILLGCIFNVLAKFVPKFISLKMPCVDALGTIAHEKGFVSTNILLQYQIRTDLIWFQKMRTCHVAVFYFFVQFSVKLHHNHSYISNNTWKYY